MSRLFQPLKVGNITLSTRIILPPLTRARATDAHVPQSSHVKYYTQRASYPGTLLIAEGTIIAPEAGGWPNVPGIWNQEQIAAWKLVTDAVHKKGSHIFVQLCGLGRAAQPAALEAELGTGRDGKVKGPSAIAFEGGAMPIEMTDEEILKNIESFRQAALNAIEAGFDGVEVHGANGYLIDQFWHESSNQRTDSWGGSIEKRAKFGLEVTKAIVDAVGRERTGVRLSPFGTFQGMQMEQSKIEAEFSYITQELKKLNLAYLHLVECRADGSPGDVEAKDLKFVINIWGNTSPVFLAGGFSPESAYKVLDEDFKDFDVAIGFGRHFISNPDLVYRIKEKIQLTPYDRSAFYTNDQVLGYTDWPFSKEIGAEGIKLQA